LSNMWRRAEIALTATASLLLSALLAHYFFKTTLLKHLDSVFLFEGSLSALSTGIPTSGTVPSLMAALKTFTQPIESVCSAPLQVPTLATYDVLKNHAYYALYPISVLTAFTTPELAFAVLNAIAHALVVTMPFAFLRSQKAGVLPSLAFAIWVAFYPAWSYSATGDYYLDRLYMPFALAALYFLHAAHQRQARWWALIGFAVSAGVAALITERAGLMMVGAGFFYGLLFGRQRDARTTLVVVVVVGLIAAYLAAYFAFQYEGFSGNLLTNSLLVLRNPLARLRAPGMIPFALVNAVFLGLFLPFAGVRYALLALGALLPNLLITIGGAELNGWSTHYHVMYVPFVVFVASAGFLRLTRLFHRRLASVGMLILVGCGVYLLVNRMDPLPASPGPTPTMSLRRCIATISILGARVSVPSPTSWRHSTRSSLQDPA
jgi:hypothetical protein